jgi:hypothetical protein
VEELLEERGLNCVPNARPNKSDFHFLALKNRIAPALSLEAITSDCVSAA